MDNITNPALSPSVVENTRAYHHAQRTAASSQTKADQSVFHQMAASLMRDRGYQVVHIAKILGLSERSIYGYLESPCHELIAEQKANAERLQGIVARTLTAPNELFCQPDDFLTDEEMLRAEIGVRLARGMRKADVARQLGMSRQLLQHHAKFLSVPPASAAYARDCAAYTATLLMIIAYLAMRPWLRAEP
jgi:predicted transcriptional regulator